MVVSCTHEQVRAARWSLSTAVSGVLLAAAAIFAGVLCFHLSPALGVLSTVASFVLMALPGVFIGMGLFGWDVRRQPESVIFGVPLGLMLSGYTALMLGFLGHWSVSAIVPALLALAGASGYFALRQGRAPLVTALRPWSASDFAVLGCMGLGVLGFVAIPFLRIGAPTPYGHAFAWLFGFDFIARAAYAASITIGLPIDHIHMAGVPLHMYLVGYVLPAFSYTLCRQAVHLQAILLVVEVMLDLAFVACLLAFWRLFARSTKALAATAAVLLAGYSYYGWFVIAHQFTPLISRSLAEKLENQFVYGGVSHLFQRLFMVEPQAVLALTIFLFVLTVVLTAEQRMGLALSCWLGLALGIEFGIDSWLGLTLAAWFAGSQIVRLRGRWSDREIWTNGLVAGAIMGTLWATFFAVHMVGLSSGSLVTIGPYWWGFKFGALQYIIEYGPMLPLGLLGLVSVWKRNRYLALGLGLIVGLAVFQDLFVGIAELPHFRNGNRLLPIALLAATAWLFEHMRMTAAKRGLAAAAILLATPTLFTDISGASNVLNRRHTAYVSSADMEACEWARTHLPAAAIVQGLPDYVGDYLTPPHAYEGQEVSLVPVFALRRAALGEEYIARAMCPGCATMVKAREADMHAMFRAQDAAEVLAIAAKYKIDYLYVGPYEQILDPKILAVLEGSPEFVQVYGKDSVYIFRIAKAQLTSSAPTPTDQPAR